MINLSSKSLGKVLDVNEEVREVFERSFLMYQNGLTEDILEAFMSSDRYNEWRKLIDEVSYDYEDSKEYIRSEKIRLSNQKVKSKPKPFSRRIRRNQNR